MSSRPQEQRKARELRGLLDVMVMEQRTRPMIDTDQLHLGLKEHRFQAVELTNIYDGNTEGAAILTKKRGRGHKWQYAGDNDEPYRYDTLKDAREDVQKLKVWAAA